MTINVLELIDTLEQEATLYGESNAPEHELEAIRIQCTANVVRQFRDCLISIANCQAGVASHAAKDALTATGHCAHECCKFEADTEASKWTCLICERESDERLMPFE